MDFTPFSKPKAKQAASEAHDQEEDTETQTGITSHLSLKPAHTTQPLDKDVVLRRIRHRKRVNKVTTALQSLLNRPVLAGNNNGEKKVVTAPEQIWWEDAFSAP